MNIGRGQGPILTRLEWKLPAPISKTPPATTQDVKLTRESAARRPRNIDFPDAAPQALQEPTLVAIRGKRVILDDAITLTALILDDRFEAERRSRSIVMPSCRGGKSHQRTSSNGLRHDGTGVRFKSGPVTSSDVRNSDLKVAICRLDEVGRNVRSGRKGTEPQHQSLSLGGSAASRGLALPSSEEENCRQSRTTPTFMTQSKSNHVLK
ncbi:hypothetical protein B0H14DRAFT_2566527 [Mycena olivaceomarginata]|nr:hypothetical protein B0H14DRAFT_2566527 [Mycena olivaceomarginata]